eukprot:COSAG01_NODE_68445_length_264_cov_0.624242_1_plen_47_part_01
MRHSETETHELAAAGRARHAGAAGEKAGRSWGRTELVLGPHGAHERP